VIYAELVAEPGEDREGWANPPDPEVFYRR